MRHIWAENGANSRALRPDSTSAFSRRNISPVSWNQALIQINTQNLQISQGYIFLIVQHLATKLCNFTNFNTLLLAVVMDFVLLA
jgi:hypothetical protein